MRETETSGPDTGGDWVDEPEEVFMVDVTFPVRYVVAGIGGGRIDRDEMLERLQEAAASVAGTFVVFPARGEPYRAALAPAAGEWIATVQEWDAVIDRVWRVSGE